MDDLDALVDYSIAEAARAYTARLTELAGATPATWGEIRIAVDWALHDLLVATGEPCGCDPGSCPADDYDEPPDFGLRPDEPIVPNPAYL